MEPLASRRLRAYLYAVAALPPPETDVWPFQGSLLQRDTIARPELLDLLAVRTLILPATQAAPDRMSHVATVEGLAMHLNPHALPRAYLVTRARFVGDEEAALATLTMPDFDGREEAVVVGERDAELADGPRLPARRATLIVDQPERVAIDVDVKRPSLLVLADAFAPGWHVAVDGEPRPARQVNYYVRGVVLAPGDRRVEFRYTAPGLAQGLAIAAAAWALLPIAVAIGRRRQPADAVLYLRLPGSGLHGGSRSAFREGRAV